MHVDVYYHDSYFSVRGAFWLWTVWGVVCAAIVYWFDRSFPAALPWCVAGVGIGRYGEAVWGRLFDIVFTAQSRFLGFDRTIGDFEFDWVPSERTSPLHFLVTNLLDDVVDPNRKPWEIYGGFLLGGAAMHGLAFGTILGALLPLSAEWPYSAFVGALLGALAGPAAIAVLYAILLPVLFFMECRGPSIQKLRRVAHSAVEEADRLGHSSLEAGHLLIALLRNPQGAVAHLLAQRPADFDSANEIIVAALTTNEEQSFCDAFQQAVEIARSLEHREVDTGHLLLAILQVRPNPTKQALDLAGVDPDNVRAALLDYWKAESGDG